MDRVDAQGTDKQKENFVNHHKVQQYTEIKRRGETETAATKQRIDSTKRRCKKETGCDWHILTRARWIAADGGLEQFDEEGKMGGGKIKKKKKGRTRQERQDLLETKKGRYFF